MNAGKRGLLGGGALIALVFDDSREPVSQSSQRGAVFR